MSTKQTIIHWHKHQAVFFWHKLIGLSVVLCCVAASAVWSQDKAATQPTTANIAQDSTKKQWDPISLTGLRLGVDITEPVISYIDFDTISYEFTADFMLNNKFFVAADFGFRGYSRGGPTMAYIATGNYFRAGVDYNLLHKGSFTDALIVGVRYAVSSFEHEVLYQEEDPYWFDRDLGVPLRVTDFKESGLSANWWELVLGVKVTIYKNLYLFTMGKARFLGNVSGNEGLDANFIPGYGFNRGGGRLGFNVQLAYRIPLFPFRLKSKEREEE